MSTGEPFTAFDHVTEREVGPWHDCTFAAMLEVCRDGFPDGRDIPPTVAEKEALRAAAGLPDDHGGATVRQAITGAENRYDLAGGYRVTTDWAVLRIALSDVESRCLVQGSMGSVPVWLRRHDPNFSGAHAVAARGRTWCDPLAPKGAYSGEWVSLATWEAYFRGLAGAQALIAKAGGLTRSDMAMYERRPVTGRFTIPAGRSVKGYRPVATGWEVAKTWAAQPTPSSAPFDGHYVRMAGATVPASLLLATAGFFDGLYVSTAEVTEAFDPDATPYSQADVDAAYERGKAEGDVKHSVTLQIDGAAVSTTEV